MKVCDVTPFVIGCRWSPVPCPVVFAYAFERFGLRAIVSSCIEDDGRQWVHLSISRASKLPSWDDLTLARNDILGPERKCVVIVAPVSEHVNVHPYCMHLWHCVDDILPDFRKDGMI